MKTTGLTLKEALESLQPIKRPHDEEWHIPCDYSRFKVVDAVATDWMIKPKPREWDVLLNERSQTVHSYSGEPNAHLWKPIRVREILE